VVEIRHYVTRAGNDIFDEWLSRLRDVRTQAKILARINRVAAGNFGDCRPVEHGFWELRIDWGPGYRVYYAMTGKTCAVLLCGGDKHRQSSDIERALNYLKDYKERRRLDETQNDCRA
jgi:putative addiction module killer protein